MPLQTSSRRSNPACFSPRSSCSLVLISPTVDEPGDCCVDGHWPLRIRGWSTHRSITGRTLP
jgi:hypothetical protein